ncbi:hypothetical protein KY495_14585 [Massilia sp. PAMC28688]|uniref:hypothetical protein n=1 Tax=Massilia sp. PAMC28688 TaxID=2861283 RepID=UPI001C627FDC|nr:hypothetical protein [Massilia sp. PAMC28688]QYF92000.1 hypothetical protein KY495_14585 [Massilia sp. PAMC28688]
MKKSAMTLSAVLLLAAAACNSRTESTTSLDNQTPVTAGITAVTTDNKGSAMTDNASVRQQLQVDASGGKVVVNLKVENGTASPVFVPKAVFVDDEIFRREFEVTNKATGAEVDYIGPMVKRGPFTRDDFVAVPPGQSLANSIDITRSYDFKPGTTYELKYAGAYLGDVAQLDVTSPVAVAPVTFTFNKP